LAICEQCGVEFTPHHKNQVARYCSRACYARAQKALSPRECPVCGKMFEPRKSISLYCSKPCSNRARARAPQVRFWEHVDKRGDCWLWTGALDSSGRYGWFTVESGKMVTAHRYAYELAHGAIPSGNYVLHTCDTPACVRPEHLFLGTNQDNSDDKVAKRRHGFGESHPRAKLTDEEVRAIRSSYERGGVSQMALAAEYGVHQSIISDVIRHVLWRHVKD